MGKDVFNQLILLKTQALALNRFSFDNSSRLKLINQKLLDLLTGQKVFVNSGLEMEIVDQIESFRDLRFDLDREISFKYKLELTLTFIDKLSEPKF